MARSRSYIMAFLNDFPPAACRLVARKQHGTRPMSTREIASVSGLSKSAVAKLSKLRTWKTVGVGTMQRFSLACGVNLLALSEQKDFWKRRRLIYRRSGTASQRRMFNRLESDLCSRGKSPT